MSNTKVNILIVEDDPDDHKLIERLLSQESPQAFSLEWMDNYDDALELIQSHRHDVCLLDYRLGHRDGLDFLREALELGCKIPIILLTGQSDYSIDMEAMNAGASDFLEKGKIDSRLLERSIRYAVTRKRLEDQIRETSRMASNGQLAAGVAHEINNPLTTVIGYSHLLLTRNLEDPAATEDVQMIHREAKRAAKIVQNLLFYARRTEAKRKQVAISLLVERALELKSHAFRINNITVVSEILPDLPWILADEHQLLQVFLNILTNAEQACLAASGEGQLSIRLTSMDEQVVISISDNGPGIPQDNINKVFDPFFTTKGVGEGTGLGLSICHGIIQQHNGELWVESPDGSGATFNIKLPCVSTVPDVPGPLIEPKPDMSATGHLLVVDDEPLIRDILYKFLETRQFEVDLAEEGGGAWRRIQACSYDCILLDLRMPGINGRQLYLQLVESGLGVADKVIFMTGDTVNSDTWEFIESTGNAVMTKPLDFEKLNQAVLELVGSPN